MREAFNSAGDARASPNKPPSAVLAAAGAKLCGVEGPTKQAFASLFPGAKIESEEVMGKLCFALSYQYEVLYGAGQMGFEENPTGTPGHQQQGGEGTSPRVVIRNDVDGTDAEWPFGQ